MGIYWVGKRITNEQQDQVWTDPDAAWTILGEPDLHLQKTWQGLHYLLHEDAGRAIRTGTPVGGDPGYGPARIVLPDEVAEIAAALTAIDTETLRARYDPSEMDDLDIYPGNWAESPFDGFVAPYLTDLRDFYRSAAAEKQAVLQGLT